MTPEPVESIVEAIDDETDDIDVVSEQLAVHSIESENRHEEILERIDQCQTQLANLSQTEAAENPMLAELRTQIAELNRLLIEVKSSTDTMLKDRTPRPSAEPPVVEAPLEPQSLPSAEPLIEEPSVAEPAPKAHQKHRFI